MVRPCWPMWPLAAALVVALAGCALAEDPAVARQGENCRAMPRCQGAVGGCGLVPEEGEVDEFMVEMSTDMDAETVAELKRWKVAERLRAGTAWESGDWGFTNEIGRPWRPDTLTCAFKRRPKAVGLPSTNIRGLRHAHATALLRAGAHPKVVQDRLGHPSISVTMDIYSSVLPGMRREAVDRLAAMMGG